MYNGYKIIDADSHTMEPDSLWDKYLEPEYRPWAPGGSQSKITLQNLTTKGFSIGNDGKPGAPYIHDGEGGLLTYAEAFKPYLDRNFDAKSFLTYMDITGIDLLVLYPTQCLGLTAQIRGEGRQMQSPKIADALSRAYNNWVYDFSNEGEGRLFGAGYIDLRDAGMAAKEVRRCVKELGLKALYYMPQPVSGIPLHHPYYDEVWAEIADSGVPLGIHFTQGSARIGQEYWGDWSLGRAATAFPFEEMMTCVSLTGGGVLERHPNMKVVFLESGAGGPPTGSGGATTNGTRRPSCEARTPPRRPPSTSSGSATCLGSPMSRDSATAFRLVWRTISARPRTFPIPRTCTSPGSWTSSSVSKASY